MRGGCVDLALDHLDDAAAAPFDVRQLLTSFPALVELTLWKFPVERQPASGVGYHGRGDLFDNCDREPLRKQEVQVRGRKLGIWAPATDQVEFDL